MDLYDLGETVSHVQPVHCTEAELQLKRGPTSLQDLSPGHPSTVSLHVTILCQEWVLPSTNLTVQGTEGPTMGEMRWGRLHPRAGCKFDILWFSSILWGNKRVAPFKTVPLFLVGS